MRHQALRYVGFCPASPKRIHPLGPGLVEGVEAVEFPIKDTAATPLVFRTLIHLQGNSQDGCLIKDCILNPSRGLNSAYIHLRISLV